MGGLGRWGEWAGMAVGLCFVSSVLVVSLPNFEVLCRKMIDGVYEVEDGVYDHKGIYSTFRKKAMML